MSQEQSYRTVDIERRGYGRRYTWLPVDELSHQAFMIDLTSTYVRPEMLDIRPNDIVRWREGERYIQGRITGVQRVDGRLQAQIEDAQPLPPEAFYP